MTCQAVEKLFSNMKLLEAKISDAKTKKEQLKARAQTAKVQLCFLGVTHDHHSYAFLTCMMKKTDFTVFTVMILCPNMHYVCTFGMVL
jgi:hypothetical protein